MAALLLIACLSLALIALAMRRALPIAFGAATAWPALQAMHDPLAACMIAIAMFGLCSTLIDQAALSHRAALRFSVRAVECGAGAIVAAYCAWTIARGFDGAGTMTSAPALIISAALLGGLITASRYRTAS